MEIKNYLLKREIQIFLVSIIFLLIFTNPNMRFHNERSRMATIESLVERGTFIIDDSSFIEGCADKIKVNGHFYSEKPPVLSILGAGIYWIVKSMFGLNVNESLIIPYLIVFFLVVIPYSLLLVYFYKALYLVNLKEKYRLLLTFGLGVATSILPRTIVFLNHVLALALVFISFYVLLRLKLLKKEDPAKGLFLTGILVGSATIIDYTCGVFIILYILYMILMPKLRNKYFLFLIGIIIPLGIHFIINYTIFGTFRPAYYIIGAYEYPNSPWPIFFWSNINGNPLIDIFNLFWGNRGLFVYSPIVITPFIYMVFIVFSKKNKLRKEALVVLSAVCLIYGAYVNPYFRPSMISNTYGFRFGLVVIPLIMFFGAYFLKENKSKIRLILFYISFVLSAIISIISLIYYRGWIYSAWDIISLNSMMIFSGIIFILFGILYYLDI